MMQARLRHWLYLPAGWVFLVYALLAAGVAWWMRVYPGVAWASDAGVLLPLILAGAAVGWLLTTLLWLLSDRNSGIFHGVFLGILSCGLLILLIAAREAQYAHDQEVADQITATRLAMRRQALAETEQALAEMAERQARLQEDRFARYEGRVEPALLDRMRAVDEEIVNGLQAAAAKYEAVLTEHEVVGPESWLRLATREELEAERADHTAIYEAARVYNDHLDSLDARYNEALEALALPSPADRYAIAEMERLLQAWKYSGALRMRELDVEISGIAIRAIDLLLGNWDAWRFDRANSRVRFDNSTVEMSFMQLLSEAAEKASEQAEIRRNLEAARTRTEDALPVPE